MQSPAARRPALSLVVVSALLFMSYLYMQNKSYGYDSCAYSESIKYGKDLFHPHHLIYNYVFHLIYGSVSRFFNLEAMAVASAFNGLAMAGNALLVGYIVLRLTTNLGISVRATVFYGICYAPLFVATSVEVYPWNILFDLLAFVVLLRPGAPTPGRALLVGGLAGLAALFHQTAVFAALALLAYLVWLRSRALVVSLYATAAALACGVPYLWVAARAGFRTPRGLLQYLFAYATSPEYHAGVWGHGLTLRRLPVAFLGMISTFSYPRLEYLFPLIKPASWGFNLPMLRALILLACLLVLIGLLVLGGWRLHSLGKPTRSVANSVPSSERPALLAMWVWLLSHGFFTLWWNPENLEFWLMCLAPLLILIAYRSNQSPRPLYSPLQLASLFALLAGVNFGFRVLPDSRPSESPVYQSVEAVGCARLSDGDWFVGAMPEMEPCVRYRCGIALQHHSLSYEFYGSPADKETVRRAYADKLAQAVRRHAVYVQEEELAPEVISPMASWSPDEARALYAPYLTAAQVLSSYERDGRRFRLYRLALPPGSAATPAGSTAPPPSSAATPATAVHPPLGSTVTPQK